MQLSPKKQSKMQRVCILLSCLIPTALGLGEARLESAVVNVAGVKGTQKSELESIREETARLQEELSKIPADLDLTPVVGSDVGHGMQAVEVAFKLPSDLQKNEWQLPPPVQSFVAAPLHRETALPQMRPHQAPKTLPKRQQSHKASFAEAQWTMQGVAAKAAVKKTTAKPVAAKSKAKAHAKVHATGGPPFIRPGAANKTADVITFGLFAKTFYGVSERDNNFVIDVVMTLKWMDKRVAALIPKGLEDLTLSKKESEMKIWLPMMAVTNRDIKKYDLISTAVMINKKGEVFKVERSQAIVKNKYVLNDYPYDTQQLVVKIASAKYMIDEVILKPATEGVGVADGLLKGFSYKLVSHEATAIKDVDGALKKSRGLLTIVVKRDTSQYVQSHLVPSFLVTCISCGVFWFPFVAPFITPRVALSILALLAFTNLSIKSTDPLPAGAPFNWNDVLNQTLMTLMFCTVVLNIFSEICFHQWKVDELARSINHECKVLQPFVAVVTVSIILSTAGPNGWMSLATCSAVVKCLIISIVGSFIALNYVRVSAALAKKQEVAKSPDQKPMGTNPNLKASA